MDTKAALTSGQLARLTGVNRETLRFYERRKLLPRPGRTMGGYRLFPPDTVDRLQFILGAKSLGFSLAEIGELLSLEGAEAQPCTHVAAEAEVKLRDVERRIHALKAIHGELTQLIAHCRSRGQRSRCGPDCLKEKSR